MTKKYHSTISVKVELKEELERHKSDGQSWTELLQIMLDVFDPESDEVKALIAMDDRERFKSAQKGMDPDSYIREEYGLDPTDYNDGKSLEKAILESLSD